MITVSRPDVSSTELQEFPVASRFLKLPIRNYLKMLTSVSDGIETNAYDQLNSGQIALINAINNPKYRFVCAALARRLGKTYIANIIAQLVTLVPGCNVLIMSPNYSLSSISFELQRKLVSKFSIEVAKNNLKDRVLELDNGSSVRMGSVNTVDSCVGRSYSMVLFDEAALDDNGKDAFNIALRPTLDSPNSKAIFISTPRGKANWFSEFYQRGFDPNFPQWASIHADYRENARMKESDVAEARRSMSKAEFEQEYMASFTTFEGQIYSAFNAEKHVKEFEVCDRVEYIAGLDPGYKDPTAFVVIAFNPIDETFHVVDEYLEAQAVTSQHADKFHAFINEYGIDPIFADPAAAQFCGDLAYTYNIATIKAKKHVNEGIAFVQNLIEQDRLFVSPHCKLTLRMLDQFRWKKDTATGTEKPDHTIDSHIADALRYALYSFCI